MVEEEEEEGGGVHLAPAWSEKFLARGSAGRVLTRLVLPVGQWVRFQRGRAAAADRSCSG